MVMFMVIFWGCVVLIVVLIVVIFLVFLIYLIYFYWKYCYLFGLKWDSFFFGNLFYILSERVKGLIIYEIFGKFYEIYGLVVFLFVYYNLFMFVFDLEFV